MGVQTAAAGRQISSVRVVTVTVAYERCSVPQCVGVRSDGKVCVAHVDRVRLAEHVAGLRERGVLDARGARVDRELLEALLDGFGERDGFTRRLRDVDFSGATFTDSASFAGCVFAGFAHFSGAQFESD